jgi:hypothetical protein
MSLKLRNASCENYRGVKEWLDEEQIPNSPLQGWNNTLDSGKRPRVRVHKRATCLHGAARVTVSPGSARASQNPGRRAEVRVQRPKCRGQSAEVRVQKSQCKGHTAQGQSAEVRGQRPKGKG